MHVCAVIIIMPVSGSTINCKSQKCDRDINFFDVCQAISSLSVSPTTEEKEEEKDPQDSEFYSQGTVLRQWNSVILNTEE